MKKILYYLIFTLLSSIIFTTIFLTVIGYETNKFNLLLEKKIIEKEPNLNIDLDKIKIKFNPKKLSFFITTYKPEVKYRNIRLDLSKIDAYVNLRSLITGSPEINQISINSNEININELSKVLKFAKPSNFKKFLLNNVESGKVNFNLDLSLIENKFKDYEINGYVKNLTTEIPKTKLINTSFIFSLGKNIGEINNLRGYVNGFQINSGTIEFNYGNSIEIKGSISSDIRLSKENINIFFSDEKTNFLESLSISGKFKNVFNLDFDQTLKITNYNNKIVGSIKNLEIKLYSPLTNTYLNEDITTIDLESTSFDINYDMKDKKDLISTGEYKINGKQAQKFKFKQSLKKNKKNIILDIDFNNGITVPLINYNSGEKLVKINTELIFDKQRLNLKKFSLKDDNSEIKINNLISNNKSLIKFDNISVKTFLRNEKNNDFNIKFGKKIEIRGLKYDASNLTNELGKNSDTIFLKNLNKEISVNISEIDTKVSDVISDFTLIGFIKNGKFNKIISKGNFYDDKYLDISLIEDDILKMKKLEIYSDLPKPLLTNYKFFKGLSGGQMLLNSNYNSQKSNSTLVIENFKVKNAPGLVKLLSLADFGGMVDAVSGEGLSFEKLEMKMEKNNQVLNLKELYAIGPSISILMEGYVENDSGIVSLRGTMVPAKNLNKFLSKVPIVGDILIPKEIGEGLFGISFKMKGAPGEIKTTVNPIKTLTPRFIQKALKKSN